MKILFVLSQVEVTGAETYATALASALEKMGHQIIFVSDKLKNPNQFSFYSLPIHAQNTSTFGRIRNVFALKKIIEKEKIELIHSHSRAANLISHFSSGKTPMAVTVHGRWRNHFAFRTLPCLGEKTIAVCPYLERYLIHDIGIPKESVSMIPNGIDTDYFSPSTRNEEKGSELLFAGRFSGQKGNVIRFLVREIFPQIAEQFKDFSVKIVSFSPPINDLEMIKKFNQKCGLEVIKVIDSNEDLLFHYRGATIVIGSGRVALEAMSCGKTVVSIGESSAPGLLTEEHFEKAFDSNFGDCGEWNLFEQDNHLVEDILKVLRESRLRDELSLWGRKKILEKFDSKKIALQIEKLYKELYS